MRRLALLLPLLLAGCGGRGGGGGSSAHPAKSGRAVLKVKWPDRKARLIPSAANSLVVTLATADKTVVRVKTIPRPDAGTTVTSTAFTGLPYGDLRVVVEAHPDANGGGVAQATGGGTMTVGEDAPGHIDVGLGSTVANLTITPAAPSLGTAESATLTASATDDQGNVVLLAAGGGAEALTWTSDAPAVATVAGNGPTATLTTLRAGTVNVTAALRLDDGGGVVRSAPASVTVAPTLAISPSDAQTILTNFQGSLFDEARLGLRDGLRQGGPTTRFHARWQALFPLSGVPAGATIRSATLTTSISTTIDATLSHFISAYPSASGTLTTEGPTGTTPLGALSGDLGPKTVDATAAVQACLSAGSPYAGVVTTTPSTTAWAIWAAPTLTITYSLP